MTAIIRTIDLETTGSRPPAHSVCEIGWQDVGRDGNGIWNLTGGSGAFLVDPGRGIPPATQAVHHIADEDVKGAPPWHEAAPLVLQGGDFVAFAAHRARFETRFCTPALSRGVPWICTWKCALRLWPESPGFSNQMLRYWRKPTGLERAKGLPVHRAFPDAYVTAHHLRDMLLETSIAQLIAWSKLPGLLPRVPYGADRGAVFAELPIEALTRYLKDRNEDVRYSARMALEHRGMRVPEPRQAAQNTLL
ncbi:3'-5' exonuclease [Pacificimonas sp. WHA3]|uniref:3'-5' exonuclease n=1 Tax=Pacificimonas pallii TaxID=2827236 RepID=A0ABS6SD94_9SPHN|nr:3'-5' exonuclease [Pacificimonas pallii]MBV7256385.1 3'-5' exonuclease [Pacificimonas pallii]